MPNNSGQKRPFANVANILAAPHHHHQQQQQQESISNNNILDAIKPNHLKRYRDSPGSQPANHNQNHQINGNKKKLVQKSLWLNENDENSLVGDNNKKLVSIDPTRTIEDKIKKINLTDQNQQQPIRAVKGRGFQIAPVASGLNTPKKTKTKEAAKLPLNYYESPPNRPAHVPDFDRLNLDKVETEPYYAWNIFEYFKQKEIQCKCEPYMERQKEIVPKMRSILVDWLVEMQQLFEVNHETLYHSVKIMDHYLMHKNIDCNSFQLLGITSFMIAAKLDERVCPLIDDFVYISDDAYDANDIIRMEIRILCTLDFDLNYPLSYSFLRRFARCSFQTLETLFLSRFILETSLMEYSFVSELDSKMAAASLLLALKMKNLSWNATLDYYSGYTESQLIDLVRKLNTMIKTKTPQENIRNKYSTSIFLGVANFKPLDSV